jgi:nitrate/TMAO reductase-like tetraheme cytochrome c subunit
MKRPSLTDAFRNPKTRPRAIIFSSIGVLGLAVFAVLVAVIGTSTRTFCAEICHHVQDDTIAAYNASPHANISCMACHEPANGTPIQFAMAKMKSAGELPVAITGAFTLPINKGSACALNPVEMGDKQCTQCHGGNRKITPSAGLKTNHLIHKQKGVTCTTCHNRVAHNEQTLTLKLVGNEKHADFMQMDACFRCHGLEGKHEAPGACPTCHTADFALVPANHKVAGWLPNGHSEAAKESLKEYGAATAEAETLVKEGISERVAKPVEHCSTCHVKSFCEDCHAKLAKSLKVGKA